MELKTLFNFCQHKWKHHYQNCSIARIKYQVDTLKEQYPNSLFLNAGDFFQVRIFNSIILVQQLNIKSPIPVVIFCKNNLGKHQKSRKNFYTSGVATTRRLKAIVVILALFMNFQNTGYGVLILRVTCVLINIILPSVESVLALGNVFFQLRNQVVSCKSRKLS